MKTTLLTLVTLAVMSSEAAWLTCGPCWCYEGDDWSWPFLKVAICWADVGMDTLPDTLPADLEALDVWGWSITQLKESQFKPYRHLKQIQLYNSDIGQINQGAFRFMTNLTVIGLYNNKITELPSNIFRYSPNLTKIDLSTNKIKLLQTNLFRNLTYLKTVDLNNNEITTIEEHCFVNVPQLENINLSRNKLKSLDIKFIDYTSSLKDLNLSFNPWHCDASLCGVLDFVISGKLWGNNTAVPNCTTTRNSPKREWSKPLLAVLCPHLPTKTIPPVLTIAQEESTSEIPRIISNTTSVSEGQDLRLKCKYRLPSRVVWTFNDITLPSNYEETSEESLTSTLTVTNVVRGQQGYYLCRVRSCEGCKNAGVYVSVTANAQSHFDIKQVVPFPDVNPTPDQVWQISSWTSAALHRPPVHITQHHNSPANHN